MKSYRDLLVWQKAVDLVTCCYALTKLLPRSETYGLVGQIQRAAVSIPANIAEGHGREHLGDYLRHLSIANGSLMELETHLLISQRLNYLGVDDVDRVLAQSGELSKMLCGLTKKLQAKGPNT
ncbi:MAG: four helix bundle protein [Acidobacteriia bacterium]|nr:four helix bundle protein [Terriglobia bacterium]